MIMVAAVIAVGYGLGVMSTAKSPDQLLVGAAIMLAGAIVTAFSL